MSQQLCASPQGAGQRGALAASGKVLLVPGGLAEQILCLLPSPDPCPGLLQMNSSQKLPYSAPPGQRSPVPTWELGILGSPASASLPAASLAAGLGSGQIQATPVWMQREDRRLLALS